LDILTINEPLIINFAAVIGGRNNPPHLPKAFYVMGHCCSISPLFEVQIDNVTNEDIKFCHRNSPYLEEFALLIFSKHSIITQTHSDAFVHYSPLVGRFELMNFFSTVGLEVTKDLR
jgi:hypothetical protein